MSKDNDIQENEYEKKFRKYDKLCKKRDIVGLRNLLNDNSHDHSLLNRLLRVTWCVESCRVLVEYGANFNDLFILRDTIDCSNCNKLNFLIESGADMSLNDCDLLYYAIHKTFLGISEIIIKSIQNEIPKDILNQGLDIAVGRQRASSIKLFVERGGMLTTSFYKKPHKGFDLPILKLLLDNNGINMEEHMPYLLLMATRDGFNELFTYLLNYGIPIDHMTDKIFKKAISHKRIFIVKILLEHGFLPKSNLNDLFPSGLIKILELFRSNGIDLC